MIARSFLAAAVLFLLYDLALFEPRLRARFIVQSQGQDNLIKAQEYLLTERPRRNVIVGSSLAARLWVFAEPYADFENLTFAGSGPLTGLEIISRDARPPRLVVIESNGVLRDISHDLLSSAFRPVFHDMRRFVPALCERYQPANLIIGSISETLKILRGEQRQMPLIQLRSVSTDSEDRLFQDNLARQRADLAAPLDPALLQQRIAQLKWYVADLNRKGARCVFFEMPIDTSLINLRQPSIIRRELAAAFPESEIPWIRPETGRMYRTMDGLHLPGNEAAAYASRLSRELSRLGLLD